MTTPEHIHMAINHLPFLGSGFALVVIVVGIALRNKATLITGLALAAGAGWITPLAMYSGEAACERYHEGPVKQHLDPQAEKFLEIHEHRAETWSKVMCASAVVSTIALVVSAWRFHIGVYVSFLAALLCAGSLGSGMWIAESAGKIRRPDFRQAADAIAAPNAEHGKGHHDHD